MDTTFETGIDAGPTGQALTLTRHLAATPELVFSAWTEPRHLRRWSAPHGFTIPECDGDLRVGGAWHCTMRAPDGTEHRLRGVYREIEPPRRLVYSHSWLDTAGQPGPETLLEVDIAPDGDGTRLTITQTGFASAASRDGHEVGWTETLEKLSDLFTAAPADAAIIRVVREIAAPRALVWSAWTDPVRVTRWWGPNGFTTTTHAHDLRPGGEWRFTMHGPDGTDYGNRVVFDQITPPERLTYDHFAADDPGDAPHFSARVGFSEAGAWTRVTLTMACRDIATRDHLLEFGALEGAQQTLARFAAMLAAG